MSIHFNKMVQFSLLVKAGDMLREFNFRKLPSIDNPDILSVNVCDERGNRIFFTMEKAENDWKVVPASSLPKWVEQNQVGLSNAVNEELKGWQN